MTDHEHRHLHLDTGEFWWHRHEHECDGTDFNVLHHHAPAVHDQLPEGLMRAGGVFAKGNHRDNLYDQGWRP